MIQSLIVLILGWYLFSTTLAMYNKWMFDPVKGLQIPYPIMVTAFHQFILWGFSYCFVRYKRSRNAREPVQKDIFKDWKFCLKYLVPTAIASAGDIGFGNVSFKFVPLTIYTIIKSASIAFVLLFGCLFKLEQFHWKLAAVVLIMFAGVVMMVLTPSKTDGDEFQDHSSLLFGSLLVVMSSCLSGLRWVFTQLTLRRAPALQTLPDGDVADQRELSQINYTSNEMPHPIYTINQLAPIMGVALFFTGLIVERPFPAILHSQLFTVSGDPTQRSLGSVLKGVVLLLIPGVEVFFLTICEFGILQTAQVLTLSIAGIVKELLTILLSMILLGERLNGLHNWLGMSIILLDVLYYNYFRYQQDQEALAAAEKAHQSGPLYDHVDEDEEPIPPALSSDYELDVIDTDSTLKATHHQVI